MSQQGEKYPRKTGEYKSVCVRSALAEMCLKEREATQKHRNGDSCVQMVKLLESNSFQISFGVIFGTSA